MPLTMLADLDVRIDPIREFRRVLADAPVPLERAESAYEAFVRARGKILEEAKKFHEIRGVVAGLELAGAAILQEKNLVKSELDAGRTDSSTAKRQMTSLSAAATRILQVQESRKEELFKIAGRVDGVYWAAQQSIAELARILRHFASAREREDDEDWSGRAVAPPVAAPGNGETRA
jgi:hypothetical protein